MTAPSGGCAQRSPISAGRAIVMTLRSEDRRACLQRSTYMPQTKT
jgi:hypothetical protein